MPAFIRSDKDVQNKSCRQGQNQQECSQDPQNQGQAIY